MYAKANSRSVWLSALLSLFGLILVSATWPLWTASADFPQIPFLRPLSRGPIWVDWTLVFGLVGVQAGMLALAIRKGIDKRLLAANALLFALLIGLNQHRLQAWAYQFILVSLILATHCSFSAMRSLRWLTISVYFFSAISKFDQTFFSTVGSDFVGVILNTLRVSPGQIPEWALRILVGAIPMSELAVAVGLIFQKSRRLALAGSVVMHLVLLWILGPFGLDHGTSVLIWNLFFVFLVLVLFGNAGQESSLDDQQEHAARWPGLASGLVVMAIIAPLGRPWGWLDEWPSWALYSPGGARVELLVPAAAIHRLPDDVRPFLQATEPGENWYRLRMDRWSFTATRSPIYPQARFQFAAARAISQSSGIENTVMLLVLSRADIRSGAREQAVLSGKASIDAWAGNYWLNARARNFGSAAAKTAAPR